MLATNVNFDGDAFFKDFDKSKVVESKGLHTITVFEGGMASGRPSVAFVSEMKDGTFVLAETSMNIFLSAAKAYEARFGPPSDDPISPHPHTGRPIIDPEAGMGKGGGYGS